LTVRFHLREGILIQGVELIAENAADHSLLIGIVRDRFSTRRTNAGVEYLCGDGAAYHDLE
jgi:hypothetical protein